jgi:hypothetical protein
MQVPILGEVKRDDRFGWYYSDPIPVPMFRGKICRIVLEGYDEDEAKDEFHLAISNFLSGTPAVLREADEPLFRYYKDLENWFLELSDDHVALKTADEAWEHVQLGSEPIITRRGHGDCGIYVSIECNCDWEPEHGLMLVLKNGLKVNKLGGYDGHLTNSDAYADPSLEDVIYR